MVRRAVEFSDDRFSLLNFDERWSGALADDRIRKGLGPSRCLARLQDLRFLDFLSSSAFNTMFLPQTKPSHHNVTVLVCEMRRAARKLCKDIDDDA